MRLRAKDKEHKGRAATRQLLYTSDGVLLSGRRDASTTAGTTCDVRCKSRAQIERECRMQAQHGQCECDSHPRAVAVARSFESGVSEPDTQSQDQAVPGFLRPACQAGGSK